MLFLTRISPFIRSLPRSHCQTLIENTSEVNGVFSSDGTWTTTQQWHAEERTWRSSPVFFLFFFLLIRMQWKVGGTLIFARYVFDRQTTGMPIAVGKSLLPRYVKFNCTVGIRLRKTKRGKRQKKKVGIDASPVSFHLSAIIAHCAYIAVVIQNTAWLFREITFRLFRIWGLKFDAPSVAVHCETCQTFALSAISGFRKNRRLHHAGALSRRITWIRPLLRIKRRMQIAEMFA